MSPSRSPRSFRSFILAPPSAFGIAGGIVFWWWSLGPTLLPRAWMIQGAISALSIAAGYGVGSAVGVDASMRRIVEGADGVLWAGPTEPNPVWGQLIDAREPGTPVWRSVYGEGVMTRVANTTDEIDADDGGWAAPRVLHLHHPSDPVGYWTWDTLWKRPDWTREPIGYDVSPRVE